MEMRNKNTKGILLTLATIVLVVLMLGELITYVYLNINYENISSFGNVADNSYNFVSAINGSTAAFLHTSLYTSLGALINYEASAKYATRINNTAYAIQSLMSNGMVYGYNAITFMGGETLANYTNSIKNQAKFQNINLTITNASIQVYQTTPFSLNATYKALFIINSTSGIINYPISASTGILLNGSYDLYSIQNNNYYKLTLTNSTPYAQVIGNVYAISGSNSPFLFDSGTLLVYNSLASCAGINSRYVNNNYILAVQNSVNLAGACGLGGLVTYHPNSIAPNVPYLVYNSLANSPIFNSLQNGTYALLDGQGLSLLNVSQIQSDMHNGHYFNSSFAPSYLDWAQNNVSKRSQNGLYSFNLYNRIVPLFVTTTGNSYIDVTNAPPIGSSTFHMSFSLWFNDRNTIVQSNSMMLVAENTISSDLLGLQFVGTNIILGSDDDGCGSVNSIAINNIVYPNTWYNLVGIYNTTKSSIYLNGYQIGSGSLSLCSLVGTKSLSIGKGVVPTKYFNGYISNLQIYNISLSPSQVAQLYYQGIEGTSIVPLNLTGGWQLNGNASDYSGNGRNGNAISTNPNSLAYTYINGYAGDPVYDGSFYGNTTNLMEGILNCNNLSQCSNMTLQHLYLGTGSLSVNSLLPQSEAGTLGLGNSIIPNVGSFNGNGFVYAPVSQYYVDNNNPFTFSAWVYTSNSAIGPVVSFVNCLPITTSCTGAFFMGVNKNTLYGYANQANSNTPLSYTVPTINTWHDVILTYNSAASTINLYVDGTNVASGTGSYVPTNVGAEYFTTACGASCPNPANVGHNLYGKIADVQLYANSVNAMQASQLYLNNSVIGLKPTDAWTLSGPYNGLANMTINTANALNPGFFASNYIATASICSVANTIAGICGASITQP